MKFIGLLCAILFALGIILLLNLTPKQIHSDLTSLIKKEPPLNKRISKAKGQKKQNLILKFFTDIEHSLEFAGKGDRFATICMLAFIMLIIANLIAFLLGNPLLFPILAAGMIMLPFAYIISQMAAYNKRIDRELETSLSTVTNSYIRTDNIVTAIEENIDNIKHPIKSTFMSFLGQTKLIQSNIKVALSDMKNQINNEVFKEWVDDLIACQDDNNLKHILIPTINKLSDIRVVNADLQIMLYQPRQEFITILVISLLNIPLLYFLNKSWFNNLVNTTPGKIVLFISLTLDLVATIKMFSATRPIKFRR